MHHLILLPSQSYLLNLAESRQHYPEREELNVYRELYWLDQLLRDALNPSSPNNLI